MIHDARALRPGGRITCDLCVIGSGPGGATVAALAAEAGLKVVVLEPGDYITPGQMNQREEQMLPRLLWQAGARMSTDHGTRIHQGKGVGGSSLHNLNLCKRVPPELLERWHRDRHLEHLPPAAWGPLYDEAERLLSVTSVPAEAWNRHNRILQAGTEALGWRGGGLAHNRTGCLGSGFCELGCAFDAKNNAAKVFIPRLMKAGGSVVTHAQAVRLDTRDGRVRGVSAVIVDAADPQAVGTLEIVAPRVCVSASATGTPALLLRSGLMDPGGETGRRLHLHPAVVVAGDFDEPVRAWEGIPQTYECTEQLDFAEGSDKRLWIVPAFGHPMGVATMLPGHGEAHAALMARFAHMAVLVAMLHDETNGRVDPDGDLGLTIDYRPTPPDRRSLAEGLVHGARLLFAAGARRVIVPMFPSRILDRPEQAAALAEVSIDPGTISLSAVHPMASVPMGDDPRVAAVDSRGRHHQVEGLWISDGSLFPTSIGGPPQLSIYALGLHVGRQIVAAG
jgi:choline dehydrogenase-like flavoprotein